jgi:hypothetical protein
MISCAPILARQPVYTVIDAPLLHQVLPVPAVKYFGFNCSNIRDRYHKGIDLPGNDAARTESRAQIRGCVNQRDAASIAPKRRSSQNVVTGKNAIERNPFPLKETKLF